MSKHFQIPGTKSLANRALIIAALAHGKNTIKNLPEGKDVGYMIQALKDLGIRIERKKNIIEVHGGIFHPTKKEFFTGNAGTTTRFLTSLLTLIPQKSIIRGDENMEKRPIGELVDALRAWGAHITYLKKNGFLPLEIEGGQLTGGKIQTNANMSSQYLSSLLMIAPLTEKKSEIQVVGKISSEPYVDLTLDVMKKFGAHITKKTGLTKVRKTFEIKKTQYKKATYEVESDAAGASYFAGIAHLHRKKISFNIPKNTKQGEYGFFQAMKKLGTKINCNTFPDTSMTLAVLAAVTKGKTTLTGIHHLTVKETDRLQALTNEIRKLGIKVKKTKNSLEIHGNPDLQIKKSIKIKTYDDHRMAMIFAVLKSKFPMIEIENPSCIQKSYPQFWADYRQYFTEIEKNIVLIGMRGSGKTTIGQKLASIMKYKFIDVDNEIQKREKRTIKEIIQKKGWKYFRVQESLLIKKISQKKKLIIATGGGSMIEQRNRNLLKKNGILVLLNCPINILQKRIQNDPLSSSQRPNLKSLKTLFKERKKSYYDAADLIIDSSTENEETILAKLFPKIS
ncbi:MAG: shikimate kinase [Patescibacteria group bacterium]